MSILAVDIGGTNIKAGKFEGYGEIIEFREVSSEAIKGKEVLIENLKTLIREYKDYDSIGISTTGQVDTEKGCITFADNSIPNYTGTNLKEIIEEEFRVPVIVENDAYCVALGEKFFGKGKNKENFIVLTYGTGVGGAIILNSELYKGFQGNAGEFGSMYIDGQGVYGSTCSTSALVRKAMKNDKSITNGRELIEKIKQEDVYLTNILEEWLNGVTKGISTLIHILNPQLVILGGGFMEEDSVVDKLKEKVNIEIDKSFNGVNIEKATFGNRTGLMGAVALYKLKSKL